jgi:hypothetical protein
MNIEEFRAELETRLIIEKEYLTQELLPLKVRKDWNYWESLMKNTEY